MELSLDQIHLYLQCPAKYKMRYVDGLELSETRNTTLKKSVHKTVSFFFFSAMGGWLPTLPQMKDKWANTWKEAITTGNPLEAILQTRPSLLDRKVPQKDSHHYTGLEMIHNFYHFNKDNPGNIVAVDHPYRVQIGQHVITGKFELIREIVEPDAKRYVEIVDFKTGDDSLDPFLIKNDFNITIASYAFRQLFQATEDRMKYHYLKTGRDIITERTEKDYNRVKAIVDGVVTGIAQEHYYPRQTFLCKSCEYKDICDRIIF